MEKAVKTLPLDDNLHSAIEALMKEGWQLDPGFKPIVTYHVIRQKPGADAQLQLAIDDTKIAVLRNGEIIG